MKAKLMAVVLGLTSTLAACSSEPSDEERALGFADEACTALTASFRSSSDERTVWKDVMARIDDVQSSANKASVLDDDFNRLADAINDFIPRGAAFTDWLYSTDLAVDLALYSWSGDAQALQKSVVDMNQACIEIGDRLELSEEG